MIGRLDAMGRASGRRSWRPAAAWLIAGLLAGLFVLAGPMVAGAAEEAGKRDDRPARGIAIYSDYSGVVVPVGDSVRMDLVVENKGRSDETIDLKLSSVAKGLKAALKGGNFTVTGVSVPDGKTRTLTFTAEPEKGIAPGIYAFQIDGTTTDGKLTASHKISVTAQERSRLGAQELQISTSYPVLRGQTDSKFEFSLDAANKSEADRTVDLSAQLPEKWEVNFKPGYESKQISTLRIRGGSNQTVAVEITPARDATAGEYPVLVRVSAGEAKAEAKLMVILTGIYKLDAATPTGLLSAEAVLGKPTAVSFLNIGFNSFKPENWKVEFKPEKIEALEPGAIKQVEATITPAAQALVGDYSVGLTADGEKTSRTVELRVTVKASTAWGWIGVGLIAVVIGGMGGLFAWLGRR